MQVLEQQCRIQDLKHSIGETNQKKQQDAEINQKPNTLKKKNSHCSHHYGGGKLRSQESSPEETRKKSG